jgi:hypothetical protein
VQGAEKRGGKMNILNEGKNLCSQEILNYCAI